jgi:hypothetical protein
MDLIKNKDRAKRDRVMKAIIKMVAIGIEKIKKTAQREVTRFKFIVVSQNV